MFFVNSEGRTQFVVLARTPMDERRHHPEADDLVVLHSRHLLDFDSTGANLLGNLPSTAKAPVHKSLNIVF